MDTPVQNESITADTESHKDKPASSHEDTSAQQARQNELDLSKVTTRTDEDGRVNISFGHHDYSLLKHIKKADKDDGRCEEARTHHRHFPKPSMHHHKNDFERFTDGLAHVPRMNIAILITGSRGDVQPFIALGQKLQKAPYSHRVRIGTHATFKDFVEENGLEFHSIGGDPAELMAYAIKNPGIIPSMASVKAGDIGNRKKDLAEMMEGAWAACTQPGDGINIFDISRHANDPDMLMSYPRPFVADAIIANPPTYGHIHIAEKLAVPLHLMFTMPWSPTGSFPHPLANLDASKVDARMANFLSYHRMELLTWEGLHDIINHFREKTLMLDPVSPSWGFRLFTDLKVPFTYCWSQALIPKPSDWGDYITISGFFFLSLASSYKPDDALQKFLDAGPPPVYIGFGSITVDDPDAMTKMILEAVKKAGVRALVSKGWGKIGGTNPPENIFLLGNVPHDWLFPRCSAVVHHGGAGTTAIGIALGKPTVIVPFFGDQQFWGGMVYRAGAGPEAVPYKRLTADKLAENITKALKPEIKEKAEAMAERIKGEDGPKAAAEAFQSMPQMKDVACFLCPDRVGVWRARRTNIQLSCLATAVLGAHGKIHPKHLKLVRHKIWNVEEGAADPLLGIFSALTEPVVGFVNDVGDLKKGVHHKDTADSGATANDDTPSKVSFSKASTDTDRDDPTYESGLQAAGTNATKPTKATKSGNHKRQRSGLGQVASATGSFAGSTGTRLLKFPVALCYNVANGFHNAPRHILDDQTVRPRGPITGLQSGLVEGGKSFGLGMYDAVTGLVTQPYRGYQRGKGHTGKEIHGVIKGFGQGLGGLIIKPCAAVTGPIGYSLKGVERAVEKRVSGGNQVSKQEAAIILKAREQIEEAHGRNDTDTQSHMIKVLWEQTKAGGANKRVLEKRMWQGYSELRELRENPDEAARVEKDILDKWEKLDASPVLAKLVDS